MMTELMQKFVLVGESAGSNAAVKQVKVVTSAPPPTPAGTLTVTLHVMQDTSAALACKSILCPVCNTFLRSNNLFHRKIYF